MEELFFALIPLRLLARSLAKNSGTLQLAAGPSRAANVSPHTNRRPPAVDTYLNLIFY